MVWDWHSCYKIPPCLNMPLWKSSSGFLKISMSHSVNKLLFCHKSDSANVIKLRVLKQGSSNHNVPYKWEAGRMACTRYSMTEQEFTEMPLLP
jgi:hypothetical protein